MLRGCRQGPLAPSLNRVKGSKRSKSLSNATSRKPAHCAKAAKMGVAEQECQEFRGDMPRSIIEEIEQRGVAGVREIQRPTKPDRWQGEGRLRVQLTQQRVGQIERCSHERHFSKLVQTHRMGQRDRPANRRSA